MSDDTYDFEVASAKELLSLLKHKRLSPTKFLEAVIKKIEDNPKITANQYSFLHQVVRDVLLA